MNVKPRRQEHADETKAAIVNSALELYALQGFGSTSIDAIANKARVTKGAVYHHFKNKKDVFSACFEAQAKQLSLALSTTPAGKDGWETAMNLCRSFFDFVQKSGQTSIPLQEVITVIGWEKWREIDTKYTLSHIDLVVAGLLADGLMKPYPKELVVNMVHSMMVEASMNLVCAKNKRKARQELLTLIEDMLLGLKV